MEILPTSNIYLYKGVPWDNTYEHTMYFANRNEQNTYFTSNYTAENGKVIMFTNQMYQRVRRGYLRIKQSYNYIANFNYLRFQNRGYNSTNAHGPNVAQSVKWYYAFITSCEFINNEVTEVRYEIDVMQTWICKPANVSAMTYYDYALDNCFVVREHSATDVIGENTIPEGIETGPYMLFDYGMMKALIGSSATPQEIFAKNNRRIVVASTYVYSAGAPDWQGGNMYLGMYSGIAYQVFDPDSSSDMDDLNAFLIDAAQNMREEGIIGIFMLPSVFADVTVSASGAIPTVNSVYPKQTAWTYNKGDGTYTQCRNKKLYCYPYNYMMVTTHEGNSANYRYEYFTSTDCEFRVQGTMSCVAQIQLVPRYYNMLTDIGVDDANYAEKLVISTIPQCSYTTDAYKAWVAQQGGPVGLFLDYVGTGINAIAGIAGMGGEPTIRQLSSNVSQGPGGMQSSVDIKYNQPVSQTSGIASLGSGLVNVTKMMSVQSMHAGMAPHVHGVNTQVTSMADGTFGFRVYNVRVRDEYARIIDAYFDKYGYACHRLKSPNRHARERWTYVKTADCTLTGSLPNDDAKLITDIYNNGITFWRSTATVGDYSASNNPTGEVGA